jgi:crotonobetainyl-CoA:carnitine CoA-transferase CaiB-like acyl-CoA transferase
MQRLRVLFAKKPRDEWVKALASIDIPFTAVKDMAEAFQDAQMQHRAMLQSVEHSVEGRTPQLGFRLSCPKRPVRYGQHRRRSENIPSAFLRRSAISNPKIERLRRSKAI